MPCFARAVGVAMTGTALTRPGNGAQDTRAAKGFVTDAPRFTLGDWLVDVHAHRRECRDESSALDLSMAGRGLGANPMWQVRRSLQDSATAPRYIETIRKQGYRLVAPTRMLSDQGPRSEGPSSASNSGR